MVPEVKGEFQPFTETFTLNVPGNPNKYHNLLILLSTLGIVGFTDGWIIGGHQELRDEEIAPQPVRLLQSGSLIVALNSYLRCNFSRNG